MNRIEIKTKAKKIIKGKLVELWKPIGIIFVIQLLLILLFSVLGLKEGTSEEFLFNIIVEIIISPLSVGMIVYILNFVRDQSHDINNLFSKFKLIIPIFMITFLVSLFVALWSILLVIPGIIAALGYSMVTYLLADGHTDIWGTLKKSQEMMKGYKLDYFIFNFSFFGWMFLGIITLGVAFIYVVPYLTVSQTLYYEELKIKTS